MSVLLDGCWAKIQRANETIDQFNSESNAFIVQSGEHSVIREFKDDGLKYAFIVKGSPTPPVRLSVLAGEVVHHLRSSLDWVIGALVRNKGLVPSGDHAFPICTTIENFESAKKRGCIKGVSITAENLIRAQQPYMSPTPKDTLFYALSELSRQDKHRLPLAVTATARLGQKIEIGNPNDNGPGATIVGLGPLNRHQIAEDGVEVFFIRLASPPPTFEANAQIIREIALEEFGFAKLFPVQRALIHMRDATANAIQSFVGEFS